MMMMSLPLKVQWFNFFFASSCCSCQFAFMMLNFKFVQLVLPPGLLANIVTNLMATIMGSGQCELQSRHWTALVLDGRLAAWTNVYNYREHGPLDSLPAFSDTAWHSYCSHISDKHLVENLLRILQIYQILLARQQQLNKKRQLRIYLLILSSGKYKIIVLSQKFRSETKSRIFVHFRRMANSRAFKTKFHSSSPCVHSECEHRSNMKSGRLDLEVGQNKQRRPSTNWRMSNPYAPSELEHLSWSQFTVP